MCRINWSNIMLRILILYLHGVLAGDISFHFPVTILYDRSFGNALYNDNMTIEDYWYMQLQEVDLLFQTLPGIDVSFDISVIQETILQKWGEDRYVPQTEIKKVADELRANQTLSRITIATWKIDFVKYILDPQKCEPAAQYILVLGMRFLHPTYQIRDAILNLMRLTEKTNIDFHDISWKEPSQPNLETMSFLRFCLGDGKTNSTGHKKLRFLLNAKSCRVENGNPIWLLTHKNVSELHENATCNHLVKSCLHMKENKYNDPITPRAYYNYLCETNQVCFRGHCVKAGVQIVNRKLQTCLTSTYSLLQNSYTINTETCYRNTYQPQIYTIEKQSTGGFHILIRHKQWLGTNNCISIKGSAVFAELCGSVETLRFKWIFLYSKKLKGYLLYNIDSNTFIRTVENGLLAPQKLDFENESYTWNIVQCEGNMNITTRECVDFWNMSLHNGLPWMFQPLESFVPNPGFFVVTSELPTAGSGENAIDIKWVVMICVGMLAGLLALFAVVFYCIMQKRSVKPVINDSSRSIHSQIYSSNFYPGEPDVYYSYGNKLEFPAKNISLDLKIGSGSFGNVYRGFAFEIVAAGVTTTVAVKIPGDKRNKPNSLYSETKILSGIGEHPNIIKLLGVCSDAEQAMVIFEYCTHGNLRDYLRRNGTGLASKHQVVVSFETDISTLLSGEDLSASFSFESSLESEPVTLQQLQKWAYEISSGMNYISRKRILHGDLACRNVLITNNQTVKITDFGLSKQLSKYHNYNYWTHTKGDYLPLRWMSIETLLCGLLSIEGDCWSYGVLLWEIFSLGSLPYSDMESIESLIEKISSGYRLEKPKLASDLFYNLMLRCWSRRPTDRPTFAQMEEDLKPILN